MRAQQAGVRPLLLLLAALLALLGGFGTQQASAQTFTNLTSVVILRQLPLTDTDIKANMEGLQQKLSQLRNESSRSSLQLALLSQHSRAKLNTLNGTTLEFLQNRTDSQLAEIFESIRAANYRRFMAINVIYSSLPKAFSSSNVLGMLQTLQVEDLERLASLPLAETKYQRLSNATLMELLNQIYNYGATQVRQRTCVLTAANTSTVAPLVKASTNSFARHRRSLLKSQNLQEMLQEHLQDTYRRLLEQGALREAVITAAQEVQVLPATFFGPARRLHQQQDAADSTDSTTVAAIVDNSLASQDRNESGVVPNFTAPGGPPYLQQTPETNPDGSVVGSNGQVYTPINFTDTEGLADQVAADNPQELLPPAPAEDAPASTTTVGGFTLPMDVYDPCEPGKEVEGVNCADLYPLDYGYDRPGERATAPPKAPATAPAPAPVTAPGTAPASGTGGDGTEGDGDEVSVDATQQQALGDCISTRLNASIMVNVSCSNGTSFMSALDPCAFTANRTVVDTAACAALGSCLPNNTYAVSGEPCDASVAPCTQWRINGTLTVVVTCRNGTTFNRTRDPCLLRPNGTIISEAACRNLGPCQPDSTYQSSGEPCNYTDAASRCIAGPAVGTVLNGTSNVTCIPCVNGTTPEGALCSVGASNSTQAPCVDGTTPDGLPCNGTSNSSSPAPCVDGVTADGLPCNVTSNSSSPAPCVNGTTADGLPCGAAPTNGSSSEGPCVNGTTADGTPCNTTSINNGSSSTTGPCLNGTLADGTPCNTTDSSSDVSIDERGSPCVNGARQVNGTEVPCTPDETGDANTTTSEAPAEPCVDGFLVQNGTQTDIPCNGTAAVAPDNTTTAVNSTEAGSNGTAAAPAPTLCYENGAFVLCASSPAPSETSDSGNATATSDNSTASGDAADASPEPLLEGAQGNDTTSAGNSSNAELPPAPLNGNTNATDPSTTTLPGAPAEGNSTTPAPAETVGDSPTPDAAAAPTSPDVAPSDPAGSGRTAEPAPQDSPSTSPADTTTPPTDSAGSSDTTPEDAATDATPQPPPEQPPLAPDSQTSPVATEEPTGATPEPSTALEPSAEPSPAPTPDAQPNVEATGAPAAPVAVDESAPTAPTPQPTSDGAPSTPDAAAPDVAPPTEPATPPVQETAAPPVPEPTPSTAPAPESAPAPEPVPPPPEPVPVPVPEPDTPPAPVPVPEPVSPPPEPVPVPQPVTPPPEPVPVPEPVTPPPEPAPVPEPVTPQPEPAPVPEPVTPPPEPAPVPEPVTPPPEPVPVPEPVTPPPEPVPVPEPVPPPPEPAPVPEPVTPPPEPTPPPTPAPEPAAPETAAPTGATGAAAAGH